MGHANIFLCPIGYCGVPGPPCLSHFQSLSVDGLNSCKLFNGLKGQGALVRPAVSGFL